MNQLLGPKLLSSPHSSIATEDALQGKDLVLLYFSASWCPPCKAFSPILMQFYASCKQHGVEIILVSSDRTLPSFEEYYANMPWLAMPMDAESMEYVQGVSSALSIRTIPQVVVLNYRTEKDDNHHSGEWCYITNDAKSQILMACNNSVTKKGDDDDASWRSLIQSWKNAPRVPLKQVNLGLWSSVFSKVQKGFQYVLVGGKKNDLNNNNNLEDCPPRGKNDNGNDDSETTKDLTVHEESMMDVDVCDVIIEFFQQAISRLKSYPNVPQSTQLLMKHLGDYNDSNNGNEYLIPVSLEEHRRLILQEQLLALEDTITMTQTRKKKTNGTSCITITKEMIQEHLRCLGAQEFTNITNDVNVQKELLKWMNEMNNHAREGYVRSVLWSEMQWIQSEINKGWPPIDFEHVHRSLLRRKDGVEMDRKTILEYSGLCNTAFKMKEVERYIQLEQDDLFETRRYENVSREKLSAYQRMILLQQLLFCAVGFDPSFGAEEMNRIVSSSGWFHHDEEVKNALESYFINVQLLAKDLVPDDEISEELSDVKEGGVTKVVSVKYSEKCVSVDPLRGEPHGREDAPLHARMEHNSEETQRQELKLAAKAASMQQAIIDELMGMEDGDRDEILNEARAFHELFVNQCMALKPGPDRVAYLQSVSPEQQKLLLMHKLWEELSVKAKESSEVH